MDRQDQENAASREEIESIVLEIVGAHFGLPAVTISLNDSITDDIGADFLDQSELIMTVEELFGIEIPDHILETINTIEDIITAILATSLTVDKLQLVRKTWTIIWRGRQSEDENT